MFRAIKRLFIWLGLMAEKATETSVRLDRRTARESSSRPRRGW